MTSPSLPTRLEAILYLKGRPVSIGELAELADSDRRSVEAVSYTHLTLPTR